MKQLIWIGVVVAASSATACKKKEAAKTEVVGSGSAVVAPTAATPDAEAGSATGSTAETGSGSAADSAADGADPTAKLVDPGELKTPESVLYDVGRDMYMVSNINGTPLEADDNGYLSVVNPDGSNERSNASWLWINGSAADIKLDAPKGMAISGDTLFVADITVVRQFEAKAGVQKPDIKIEGATFLNDVTPDGNGGVFVTDSGLDASFKPTGTDAVYHIAKDGKVTPRIKNKDLGAPNGVWAGDKGSIWVVTFGSGEIYEVNAKGKKLAAQKLPKGQLDGVVGIEGGEFLVSSWEGKCVYRGKPGGEWKEVVSGVESPADIAYDPKRKRILIPGFMTNKLGIFSL
ncbi:MAG: SMP-30/gluconolactonase/LRE family protein [Deltaproteobacteria bacterium]|nr:SMP-30/gluconolactonase/LRE family protein [Deltaproteobacteria bacterium]